jgi:hypothetical protein
MRKRSRTCIDARVAWPALLLLPYAAQAGNVDIVFLDSFENGCGNLLYSEPFTFADNSAWPAPWTALGGVQTADIQAESARLQPNVTSYSLARMGASVANSNVEVRFTARFDDSATQGIGFYVRQNGGYLMQTTPHGQGYAVFIETFRNPAGIGLWREVDGTEQQLLPTYATTFGAGAEYNVRFQVAQSNPTQTQLRAKIWMVSYPEPAWQITTQDTTPALQSVVGDIAVDSWSSLTAPPIYAYTHVDSVELISLCAP